MSSRIFQSVIVQMKEATDRCLGVIDDQGFVVACSELSMIGSRMEEMPSVNSEMPDQVCLAGTKTYKILGSLSSQFDYAVFVDGRDDVARCVCILSAVAISEARENYEEKHNKGTFVKNIINAKATHMINICTPAKAFCKSFSLSPSGIQFTSVRYPPTTEPHRSNAPI